MTDDFFVCSRVSPFSKDLGYHVREIHIVVPRFQEQIHAWYILRICNADNNVYGACL